MEDLVIDLDKIIQVEFVPGMIAEQLVPEPNQALISVRDPGNSNHKLHHYLIVHCNAGISRSSAIAKFLCEIYRLYFPDKYNLYNKLVYSILVKVWNQVSNGSDMEATWDT